MTSSWGATTTGWSHHPKITKQPNEKWRVVGHLAGLREFKTWDLAKRYALAKPTLVYKQGICPSAVPGRVTSCNCVGLCQPHQAWVVDEDIDCHDHAVGPLFT